MVWPSIGVGQGGQFGVSAGGGPIRSQDTKPISFSTGAFGAPATTSQNFISTGAIVIVVVVALWLVLASKR